jgi:hypothetical protein
MLPQPLWQYDARNEAETRIQIARYLQQLTPQSGTYDPDVTSSGGGETVTYSTRSGVWARVGPLIIFAVHVTLATKSGGSGDIRVSIPALGTILEHTPAVTVDNMAAGWTGAPQAIIQTGVPYLLVRELVTGALAQAWTKLGATGSIRLTGMYLAAL